MKTLEEELPLLGDGAPQWIRKLEKLTAADKLAVGDVRALILRVEGVLNVQQVEQLTGTTYLPDQAAFDSYRGLYWEALRTLWPSTNSADALLGLKKKDGEEMHVYLKRAAEEWQEGTGSRHDVNMASRLVWTDSDQRTGPISTGVTGRCGRTMQNERCRVEGARDPPCKEMR